MTATFYYNNLHLGDELGTPIPAAWQYDSRDVLVLWTDKNVNSPQYFSMSDIQSAHRAAGKGHALAAMRAGG